MTAVSRPPVFQSDSCYSPLSPLSSPSSHPPTPAHLVPSRQASAAPSPAVPQQQQRNHQRTSSPSSSTAAAPPPRPVPLARPSQGYPFPLMLSRRNTPEPRAQRRRTPAEDDGKSKQPLPALPQRRKTPAVDDGWSTPAPSRPASTASTPALQMSKAGDVPHPSSTFSDSTESSSSSTCRTPDDDAGLSHSTSSLSLHDPTSGSAPANPPSRPPVTPAEHAHSRTKHAGSTPGAVPPLPLLARNPVSQQVIDLLDRKEEGDAWDHIEEADEETTPPSLAPSPLVAPKNARKPRGTSLSN
ncbi:hypothetical protein JCM10213_004578 [Rhodosporidiobolus nylandii]